MTEKLYEASPLWCADDKPHVEHQAHNEFGGVNYCSGRPMRQERPTDAQVLAALNAYYAAESKHYEAAPELAYFHPASIEKMRGALRAATELGGN